MTQASPFPINGHDESANWAPKKYRYWYDHIIDLLLVEPELTQKEIGARLNRHAATVGMIMNSDLFRARYEQRKGAQSAALQEKLNGKLTRVAIAALDLQAEVLHQKRSTIPLPDLTDVADKTLARLGYGPKSSLPQSSVNVQVNGMVVAPITAEQLASSRAKLIEHQSLSAGVRQPPVGTPVASSASTEGERE